MAKKDSRIEPKSLEEFNATMKLFAEEMGTNVEMITREQIRLMCRDAMTFTPPMPKGGGRGLSPGAKKAGDNKLGNDVRRIFIPMDQPVRGKAVFLRQIIAAVKGTGPSGKSWMDFIHLQPTEDKIKGLSPVLRKIMQDQDPRRAFAKASNYLNKARADGSVRPLKGPNSDLPSIHDNYKNKVGGRWPKRAPIGGPQYMVGTALQLEAYIAERQHRVGRVKAGWAMAQSLVPLPVNKRGKPYNRGVYDAPWVDANRSSMGQFTATRSSQNVAMTITNLIGNINAVADEADTRNIVYGNRVKQMEASILERTNPTVYYANKGKK